MEELSRKNPDLVLIRGPSIAWKACIRDAAVLTCVRGRSRQGEVLLKPE